MKKIIAVTMILVIALIFSGCSLVSQTQNNVGNITPTVGSSVASNSIEIKGFAFNPASLTVKKGTTVTWTNSDSASHQIKSASFNSTTLATGQSFSFTFVDAGAFDYSCSIHPSMTGKIIVE
jgi:plastocyanin